MVCSGVPPFSRILEVVVLLYELALLVSRTYRIPLSWKKHTGNARKKQTAT